MFFEESGLFTTAEPVNPNLPLLRSKQSLSTQSGNTSLPNQRRAYRRIPNSTSTQYFIPNNIFWLFNSKKNLFDSRKCDTKVTESGFHHLLLEFRTKYADELNNARKRIFLMQCTRILIPAFTLLSPLLVAHNPYKWTAMMSLLYYIILILISVLNKGMMYIVCQLLQNMQQHFDQYNVETYHSIGLHFVAYFQYIQVVLDYKESDADLYQNYQYAKYGKLPVSQPGHYYFQTTLLSLNNQLKDNFDPNRVENRISSEEYTAFRDTVRLLLQQDDAFKTYKRSRVYYGVLGLIGLFWYPLLLLTLAHLPRIYTFVLSIVFFGLIVLFSRRTLSKGIQAEEYILKRAQQVIDQESAKLPNFDKIAWKMISTHFLKLQYPIQNVENDQQP